ncbi:MAG: DNA primase [Candidatus Omnitrophica bacterium]|nr:DNA primase [Candidatus Omnitrophota bacterium]
MPLIPDGVIDEVQARADIAEWIGRYVPLKRAGRHFKALCPFHKEKTPSFVVNTDKQIYHCFGCGAGGNLFSFLIQHDRLTFPEAVRQVAEQVGVEIPRAAGGREGSHEPLRAVLEQTCGYFERSLAHPAQGRSARAYLERRGVSAATRTAFRLGYAPPGWSRLVSAATRRGVAGEQLEAAGLAVQGKTGPYDRFRNRLIFPIQDVRGRVVAFGGRSLGDEEPKYLNSPETALYSKGRQLFGLAQAKDAILAQKTAVVVEGYFDCVVLAQEGVAHVVSPLGTALTSDQARLLKRYAEQVILAFDPDAAGEAATLRGIDLAVEAGLQVRIAQLPAGLDPDECVRRHGRAWLEQRLGQSVTLFDFLVDAAVRRWPPGSSEQKVKAAQFVLPTIAKVPSEMLRSEYVRQLAQRLQLDETAVLQELAKAKPRASAAMEGRHADRPLAPTTAQGPERLLVALVVEEPSRWKQAAGRISPQHIGDPSLRRLVEVVADLAQAGQQVTTAGLVSRLAGEPAAALVTELVAFAQVFEDRNAVWEDCVRRIEAQARRRRLEGLREQIRSAQEARAEADVEQLLVAYQQQLTGG